MSFFSHQTSFNSNHFVKFLNFKLKYYKLGNCSLIFLFSLPDTTSPYLFLVFDFLLLFESKCLFQACPSLNLPFQVTLTLFLTPFLVFKVIINFIKINII